MIAAHLLDAYRAAPEADDAAEIKASAREWLTRAAERAAALAAPEEAQRAFEGAAELADEPLARARLLERAGELARAGTTPTSPSSTFGRRPRSARRRARPTIAHAWPPRWE